MPVSPHTPVLAAQPTPLRSATPRILRSVRAINGGLAATMTDFVQAGVPQVRGASGSDTLTALEHLAIRTTLFTTFAYIRNLWVADETVFFFFF